jgi:ectoine hydroxylase-related dioxygenase (phytanoyl-CoA dioxygenase family)
MQRDFLEMSEHQVEFFQEFGYLKIDKILTEDELARIRDIYDKIVAQAPYFHIGVDCLDASLTPGLFWIHTPELSFPQLKTDKLLDYSRYISAKLLNVEQSNIHTSFRIFYKPAFIGKEIPWHQDEAYHNLRYYFHSLNVWVALDAVAKDSGCMNFIPASHKGEVRFHRQISQDLTDGLGLMADGVNSANAIPCSVPVGGATVHHCRTLHSSSPNHGSTERRALVIVCETPATELDQIEYRPWQSSWSDRSWFQAK